MNQKVFNEWVARLEEAAENYAIHRNIEWKTALDTARDKLKECYRKEQRDKIIAESMLKNYEALKKLADH